MARLLQALADTVASGAGAVEAGSPTYLLVLLRSLRKDGDANLVAPPASTLIQPLTARELEVLRLIAGGMRNQEIAEHLVLSVSTVKRHIANVYGKLDVGHRTEALARAAELKLL